MSEAILLIDEDVTELRRLGGDLEAAGFEVARELDPAAALSAADRLAPDVAVVGERVAGADQGRLIAALRQRGIPVIVTVEGVGSRVAAMLEAGADCIVVQPVESRALALTARRAAQGTRSAMALRLMAGAPACSLEALGMLPPMRGLGLEAAELARHDRAAVLVTGEPGVGKTWVARLIHQLSSRAETPFLTIEAAGAGLHRLEAQLFGREAEALRGADRRIRGLLELAGKGTLVVREIARLPMELQPGILRVLEQQTFRRVGGRRDLASEARVVATASGDLAAATERDEFRGDLLERLSGVTLRVPPVRERADADRRELILDLHRRLASRAPGAQPPFSTEALDRLVAHHWPGNVSEIVNVIERAVLLAAGQPMILVEHLPGELRARAGLGDRRHHPMTLDEVERHQIESSLRFHGGNRTRAARELGISRATLINKIKRYRLTE